MISFLSIKTDFKICIISSIRCNLCSIKRQNMVDNSLNRLLRKIGIINAEIVVKPASLHPVSQRSTNQLGVNLIIDQFSRNKPFCSQKRDDTAKLFFLSSEPRVRVSCLLTDPVTILVSEREMCCHGGACTRSTSRSTTS